MNKVSGVEISPERLTRWVNMAIKSHKEYDKESNFTYYEKWDWKTFRKKKVKLYDYPSWAYPYSGTLNRLLELKTIAEGVGEGDKIFLSELTFLNLILLTKKRSSFQKDIFTMRY